ncbi:hypothetical protein QBC42DRAFT_274736 [Cladorrhinum samala]|uniref:Uncharacterized protein n=1 Tax=Cladorrhinum samala TaxID=585594 RepID=A0AAV9HIK4_9PEZI|nr:hypothetical protein QBC42DRAFT_274736 [Cladorrhinum samala]
MMFLHSGASIHGHEFSGPQQPTHNLRNPLLRSALITPQKQQGNANGSAPAPVLRQRPVSDYIPRRAPSPVVRFREPNETPPETPMTPEDPSSDSDLSDAVPSVDGTAAVRSPSRPRRQRIPRKSTTYGLGYPTPSLLDRTKYVRKVLPRLLLQLQKVSEDGRPRPVLEVFPSSRIAGPVIAPRLAKRFPGIFGVKHHLAYDDIVLVRRDDDYEETENGEAETEDALEKRRLVAVYSPLRHSDDAEIVLDDGSVWLATPLPNGSYDFVHTDAAGDTTTVRWARRHKMLSSPTLASAAEPSTPSPITSTLRYTFSIINPLTRRHPVLATLTPTSLNVQDTYTSVALSSRRHRPSRKVDRSNSVNTTTHSTMHSAAISPTQLSSPGFSSDGESDHCHADSQFALSGGESLNRPVHVIDDKTKMLITVTSLWVALRSGWSPNHTPHHHELLTSPSTASHASRLARSRRNTWGSRSCASEATSILSTATIEPPSANHQTPTALKRNSLPARCLSFDKEKFSSPVLDASSRASTPASSIAPRKATSTGAAYMQRRLQESSETHTPMAPESIAIPPPTLIETKLSEESSRPSRCPSVTVKMLPGSRCGSLKLGTASRRNSMAEDESKPKKRGSILGKRDSILGKRDSILGRNRKRELVTEKDMYMGMEGSDKEKKGMRSRMVRWVKGLGTR